MVHDLTKAHANQVLRTTGAPSNRKAAFKLPPNALTGKMVRHPAPGGWSALGEWPIRCLGHAILFLSINPRRTSNSVPLRSAAIFALFLLDEVGSLVVRIGREISCRASHYKKTLSAYSQAGECNKQAGMASARVIEKSSITAHEGEPPSNMGPQEFHFPTPGLSVDSQVCSGCLQRPRAPVPRLDPKAVMPGTVHDLADSNESQAR